MILYRIMAEEKQDMAAIQHNLDQIMWYINHPPLMFPEIGTGTDTLRHRPKINLSEVRMLTDIILTDLELLQAAHSNRSDIPRRER